MSKKVNHWWLVLILIAAAGLRLYALNKVPPSLHWDEAALGYNAYSILKTGRDEYGHWLTLIFKSFGDYKPGLYVYLTVPFVAILGLTEMAVRLPSALIGIATVWLLYQTTWLLFKKRELSLLASFALAVSPWHLHFSRGAWEANVALFFILGGIYSFLRANKKEIKWLYFSALSFTGAVLVYQGGKINVPLIVLGLWLCFSEKAKRLPKKHLLKAAVLLFIFSLPILMAIFTGGGGRLRVMSVLSYHRPVEEISQILSQDRGNKFYFQLFQSETFFFIRSILGRYFNHFSGRFLFFEGDWSSPRHSVPYAGVLYYLDLIFLLAGIYWLTQQKSSSEKFVWYWLLVSPLPAALSRDAIQAVRAMMMVLPLMTIIGAGIFQIRQWIAKQKYAVKTICYSLLAISYLWCFIYYLDQYYVHYPRRSSEFWQYGYKEVVNRIYPIKDNYSQIIFTQKWGQPYIYWLFYTRHNPVEYQKQASLAENFYGDVGRVEKIDKIEFREFYWPSARGLKKTLFVGTEYELPLEDIEPHQARLIEEIRFLDGKVAFRIAETY